MSDHSYDAFERALITSAKADAMSADRKRALAASLAGGAAAATVTSIAAGAPSTSITAAVGARATTAIAGAGAAQAKAGVGLALVKWVVAAIAGTAMVAGGVEVGTRNSRRASAPAAPTAPEVAASEASSPPAALAAPAEPAPSSGAPAVAPLEVTAVNDLVPAPPSVPARRNSAPRASTPALADELRLIEQARSSLAANDVAGADGALDLYARSFASGAFADEARVLRIDAMARRGDRTHAESAARAYLAANPNSPYAPRLRALVGEDPVR